MGRGTGQGKRRSWCSNWHFVRSSVYFCLDHKAHEKHRACISWRYAKSSWTLTFSWTHLPSLILCFNLECIESTPVFIPLCDYHFHKYLQTKADFSCHFLSLIPTALATWDPSPHSRPVSLAWRVTLCVLAQVPWSWFLLLSPLFPFYHGPALSPGVREQETHEEYVYLMNKPFATEARLHLKPHRIVGCQWVSVLRALLKHTRLQRRLVSTLGPLRHQLRCS